MRLLVLTDRAQVRRPLLDVVEAAVAGGARWVLLREKDLPREDRADLVRAVQALLRAGTGGLLVASDVALARETGAAGVHLAAADPWPDRGDLVAGGRRLLVGRSCHDRAELEEARAHGADYATLSPVFVSASKPGYGPALGLDQLARLCRTVPDLPVLALGGIGPAQVGPCLAAGAAGVAVMGEVMRADDPGAAVAALAGRAA